MFLGTFCQYMLGLGYVPKTCIAHLDWAFNQGKHWGYYADMKDEVGVEARYGRKNDFQRYFKCKGVQKADCNDKGLAFPETCSAPPCNHCRSISGNINNQMIRYKTLNNKIMYTQKHFFKKYRRIFLLQMILLQQHRQQLLGQVVLEYYNHTSMYFPV